MTIKVEPKDNTYIVSTATPGIKETEEVGVLKKEDAGWCFTQTCKEGIDQYNLLGIVNTIQKIEKIERMR